MGISVDKRGPRYTLAYAALALGIGCACFKLPAAWGDADLADNRKTQ